LPKFASKYNKNFSRAIPHIIPNTTEKNIHFNIAITKSTSIYLNTQKLAEDTINTIIGIPGPKNSNLLPASASKFIVRYERETTVSICAINVKTKYRKLAMKYHPDRNPDDKAE